MCPSQQVLVSQESADSISDSNGQASMSDGSASATLMRRRSSGRTGPMSRSTRTSGSSKERRWTQSTLSSEGSPARISATRARVRASQGRGPGSSMSRPGSFGRFDPDTCWWRTSQRSVEGDWIPLSSIWPWAGMMCSGILYRRPPSGRSIDVTGYSSSPSDTTFPTPTVSDTYTDILGSSQQKDGSRHSVTLAQAVKTPLSLSDSAGERREYRPSGEPFLYHQMPQRTSGRSGAGDVQDADGQDRPERSAEKGRGTHPLRRDQARLRSGHPDIHGDRGPHDRDLFHGPFVRPPEYRRDWETEPDVGRVAHGVPSRLDRLRCLGNAVVPQVGEHIGRLVIEYDRRRCTG